MQAHTPLFSTLHMTPPPNHPFPSRASHTVPRGTQAPHQLPTVLWGDGSGPRGPECCFKLLLRGPCVVCPKVLLSRKPRLFDGGELKTVITLSPCSSDYHLNAGWSPLSPHAEARAFSSTPGIAHRPQRHGRIWPISPSEPALAPVLAQSRPWRHGARRGFEDRSGAPWVRERVPSLTPGGTPT